MTLTPKASRPYMPGYGLKPADQGSGLKPWSYAVERLTRSRGYWVSTTRPDGRPHCVPIWGVWLRDVFAFSTGAQSRKTKNLASDPRVVIGVEPTEDSIVLEGIAKLIDEADFIREFKRIYAEKYQMDMDDFSEPVWSVKPVVAFSFSSQGDEFTGGSTRWTF
jgi:Pyridoxamine 5'-phosphate oxidase